MKWPFALAMLLWTASTLTGQTVAPSAGAVELGHGWQRIADPATLGYSRAGLDSALAIAQGMKTSALLVAVGGRSLLEHGDLADTSYVASARKSMLSMLYGRYVENGTIRLDETLADIGIDDRSALLPLERTATVEHLLGARSGVYHPASNAFHGSYAAHGAAGQYILVVPKLDMVVAHTVVSRGSGPPTADESVTPLQFEALVRAIAGARCQSVTAGATPSQQASPRPARRGSAATPPPAER